jgi:hypothetical protein
MITPDAFRFERESLQVLASSLERLEAGFAHLPAVAPELAQRDESERVLGVVAERLGDN